MMFHHLVSTKAESSSAELHACIWDIEKPSQFSCSETKYEIVKEALLKPFWLKHFQYAPISTSSFSFIARSIKFHYFFLYYEIVAEWNVFWNLRVLMPYRGQLIAFRFWTLVFCAVMSNLLWGMFICIVIIINNSCVKFWTFIRFYA